MICFKCGGEEFATQTAIIRQEFRDEQLDVSATVCVCSACGWQTLKPGQTDELRKLTADAYRQKHGLLTSTEIVSRRTRLGMSQRQFAAFLRVGEASVKRWETWQVQDESSDELIRMKCDFGPQSRGRPVEMVQPHRISATSFISTRMSELSSSGFCLTQLPTTSGMSAVDLPILKCHPNSRDYIQAEWFNDKSDEKYEPDTHLAAAA
jgi:putative zinc finger/helix-turn-helix YgiT family protein